MKKQIVFGLTLGVVAAFASGRIEANDGGAVPAAKVVWQLVGKTLLNPATGAGQAGSGFQQSRVVLGWSATGEFQPAGGAD